VLPSLDGLFFWVPSPTRFSGSTSVIVGDPDLEDDKHWRFTPLLGARSEANQVAQMLETTALVGQNANLNAVMGKLQQPDLDLLYFATHGIADPINPMDGSFLALSGEHLFGAQIKRLSFSERHPVVVMSACQSALGKRFEGGVFGLARAWIHAGASIVVASLWNVNDRATAHLMNKFMEELIGGERAEVALQKASLATRRTFPNPAHWGGFIVFGYPQPVTH